MRCYLSTFPSHEGVAASLVVKAITNQTGLSWNTGHVIIAYLNLNQLTILSLSFSICWVISLLPQSCSLSPDEM